MSKISVGDRVVILDTIREYGGRYTNECGEVVKTCHQSGKCLYGVKLDNYTNIRSSYGVYWFTGRNLKLENTNKNESEEIIMFKNFNAVSIQFFDNEGVCSCPYALYDSDIKEGDNVVVNTGNHGFALAKIVTIHNDEETKNRVSLGREVVCVADFTNYNNRKDAIKKIAELKRDMEKRIREAQELALYEALAEKDPTLKVMLEQYKGIISSFE